MLGETLQSRAPSLQSWTRNTRSGFADGGATSPTTLHSKGLPSCSDVDSRRPASRIQAGQNRRLRDFEPLNVFFADHSQALSTCAKRFGIGYMAAQHARPFGFVSLWIRLG